MHRCLVVANQTLGASHLADALLDRAARAPMRFHLLVPIAHANDRPWSDAEARAETDARLERGLEWFRELGLEGTGEVGAHEVVHAVTAVLAREEFDEVLLSTQAPGVSRWLRWDVPRRVAEACPQVVLTHVVEAVEPVRT
jgi:hypothetical protein